MRWTWSSNGLRPTAWSDPCGGATTGSSGRRGCACEVGSRASWHGVGCSAGTFACSRGFLTSGGGALADLMVLAVSVLAKSGAGGWCDASRSTATARPQNLTCCEHAAGVVQMTTPRYGGASRRSNRPSYDTCERLVQATRRAPGVRWGNPLELAQPRC
jgi:hypothetical protein